jgi:hypothetical protein
MASELLRADGVALMREARGQVVEAFGEVFGLVAETGSGTR